MQFRLLKASDQHFEEYVEINTLEDLKKYDNTEDEDCFGGLLLYFNPEPTLMIYDDYID